MPRGPGLPLLTNNGLKFCWKEPIGPFETVRTVVFCVVVDPPPQAASTKEKMTRNEMSSVPVLVFAFNTEDKELGVIANLLKIPKNTQFLLN